MFCAKVNECTGNYGKFDGRRRLQALRALRGAKRQFLPVGLNDIGNVMCSLFKINSEARGIVCEQELGDHA